MYCLKCEICQSLLPIRFSMVIRILCSIAHFSKIRMLRTTRFASLTWARALGGKCGKPQRCFLPRSGGHLAKDHGVQGIPKCKPKRGSATCNSSNLANMLSKAWASPKSYFEPCKIFDSSATIPSLRTALARCHRTGVIGKVLQSQM